MSNNINPSEGGGPWLLDLDGDLEPGDFEVFNFKSMTYNGRKGYFRPWTPLDSILIKNLDSANPVRAEYNGKFGAIVEPNAADSYGEVGLLRLRVENLGSSTIVQDDLIIQASVEPFDADDQARQESQRHPLEKAARSLVGL